MLQTPHSDVNSKPLLDYRAALQPSPCETQAANQLKLHGTVRNWEAVLSIGHGAAVRQLLVCCQYGTHSGQVLRYRTTP